MGVYTHISGGSAQTLAFAIRDVLLCLWITVLLGHTKVDNVYNFLYKRVSRSCWCTACARYALTIGHFGPWSTDKKVIGLNVAVDQILVVNSLHTRDLHTTRLVKRRSKIKFARMNERTICRAAIHTVLIENLRPHMSNKSSRLGPRRSMTRMLCRPSWPK